MKIVDFVSIFFVLCVYVLGCFVICSEAGNHWGGIIVDDAYYYLGLARSIVISGDSAFLPPFTSNGYQPLWLLILVGTAKIFGTSDASLVFQIFSLSYIFLAVFCFVSKKVYGYAFPAVVCAFAFPDVAVRGMETALIPVLVLLLFSSKRWWVKGGVSSLLILTRLDALAVVFFEMVYSFFVEKKRDVRGGFVVLAVISAYFSANYWLYGVVVPVSGLSKSVGNVLGENYGVILSYGHALKPVVFLVVFCLPIFLLIGCRVIYKKQLIVSVACLVSEALYYGVCSGWPVWGWYMWPVMMLAYFSVLNIVQNIKNLAESREGYDSNISRKLGSVVFALLSVNLLKPAAAYCKGIISGAWGGGDSYLSKNYELASYVRRVLPPGTFLAMGDRAGSFGFFLGGGYKFLHTEGLMASFEYYKYMRRDNGRDFIRLNKIQYLIAERDRFFEGDGVIGVAEPVQGLSSHVGPYLVCFNKDGIVLDQSYVGSNGILNKRYMFDLKYEEKCPSVMQKRFYSLRNKYGELRKFSLYSEY